MSKLRRPSFFFRSACPGRHGISGGTSGALFLILATLPVVVPVTGAAAVLEEIIVTAQKREQNVQDVPISVTAFSGRDIAALGANDLRDLTRFAANVAMPGLASNVDSNITIRGISSETRNTGFDSGASMYVDGVFVGRSTAMTTDVADITMLEILRGPQGTLFGKNTIAGAINVRTRLPDDDAYATVDFQAGSDSLFRARAALGGPLTEDGRVAASISALVSDRDGFQHNVSDGRDLWTLDNKGVRAKLRFQPSDRLDIILSGDRFEDDSLLNVTTVTAGLGSACCVDDIRNTDINANGKIDRKFSGGSVTVNYTLANDAVFTSITSYRENMRIFTSDDDGTFFPVLETTFDDREDQWTQELRFSSTVGDSVGYVLGVYYFDQEVTSDRNSVTGAISAGCPVCFAPVPLGVSLDSLINARSWAVFGQTDWNITEKSILTVGLRYTNEDKDLDRFDLMGLPPFGIITLNTTDSISDDAPSWTVGLSHYFQENTMGFAKVSRGFKSGGFNADYVGSPVLAFDPEYAVTAEVGVKFEGLDNRLRLNTTVFHTVYDDLQVSVFNPDDLAGFSIKNAAEATIEGIEAELTAALTDGFELFASLGYQEAEFDEFPDAGGPGDDWDGNTLQNAPDWSGHLGAQYTLDLNGGSSFYIRGDWVYSGDYFVRASNDELSFVDSYDFFNARLGFQSASDIWLVELWAKNLGDTDYIVGKNRPLGGLFGQDGTVFGEPSTYGIRVAANW